MKAQSKFLFIIDTNQYSGNFEREMVAYMTGHVGECGVGEELAERFWKDNPHKVFQTVESIPDENGCCRPATTWDNPHYANDGMGNFYKIAGVNQKELCSIYAKSVADYYEPIIKHRLGIIKLLQEGKKIGSWTIAAAERENKQDTEKIEKARKIKKVSAYPAAFSVGVWFSEKPNGVEIELMKSRARYFCEHKLCHWSKEKIEIEGFRLLSFENKVTEENIS